VRGFVGPVAKLKLMLTKFPNQKAIDSAKDFV